MEILILAILGFLFYLLFKHLNSEIDSSSSKNSLTESLNRYSKIDIDDDWEDRDRDIYWEEGDKYFTSTDTTTDLEDRCDLSRALWDPTCPLYSALHGDRDDYHSSLDDSWSSGSSWDDSWSSSFSRDDDWSSSSTWDDDWSFGSSWDDD